jgi:hypothetical protein
MSRRKILSKSDLLACLGLFFATSPLFWVAGKTFAKTDDYVFLGLVKNDNLSIIEGFKYFSSQEWTAGRSLTNLLLPTIFASDSTVSSFSLWRIIFVVILYLITIHVYFTVKKITTSKIISFSVSIFILSIPGFQSFITLLASGSYLIGILMSLYISKKLVFDKKLNFNSYLYLGASLVVITLIYQPIVFLSLFYPALNLLSKKFDVESSRRFFLTYVLATFSLLVNLIFVKLTVSGSRTDISFNLPIKLEILINEVWDLAQLPWLRVLNIQSGTRYLLVALFLSLQLVFLRQLLKHLSLKELKTKQVFSVIFVGLGGIPFTFPWYFVIGESALDLRRYSFASAISISLFVISAHIFLKNCVKKDALLKAWKSLVVLASVFFLALSTVATVSTATTLENEWGDFLCASRQIELNENTKIRRNEILEKYQRGRTISEDINTSSLAFPNPPTFMLWLSQIEVGRTVDFPPWNMNLIDDYKYSKNDIAGQKWAEALISCSG